MTQDLREFSYYKTGGKCSKLHLPKNPDDMKKAILEIRKSAKDFFVLGGGSNSLVLDDYYDGHVIVTSLMKKLELDKSTSQLIVGAGVENSDVSNKALENGLTGIAWIHRLPGSIGGTVRMNARCYGGEISQVVSKVTSVSLDGEIKHYTQDDKVFRGYKDTLFMDNGDLICETIIDLEPGNKEKIKEKMLFCESDRISKNQFSHPSCGCVFKNDYSIGVPSGMLLDKAGVHELSDDKVCINPKHANFVFNLNASSDDILNTTTKMREAVYNKFGVWLEYEMEILGHLSEKWKKILNEKREQNIKTDELAPLLKAFNKK